MKHIDELYKEWCGESHLTNASYPVHDSSDAIDFALFYHNEMKKLAQEQYGQVMTIGAGDFEQKVHMETIQRLIRDQKNVVFITGHHLPPENILAEIVQGVKENYPDFFDTEKLYEEPMLIQRRREPPEFPELHYSKQNEKKGHERQYKFHR